MKKNERAETAMVSLNIGSPRMARSAASAFDRIYDPSVVEPMALTWRESALYAADDGAPQPKWFS